MGLGIYIRRVAPLFSRGAPAVAFLGQPGYYPYPGAGNVGYSQHRVLRVVNDTRTRNAYSVFDLNPVLPAGPGPFHSDMTTETSPLIDGQFYNVPPMVYDNGPNYYGFFEQFK